MSAVPTYRPGGTSSQTQEGGCCCWLSGSRMSTSLRHAPGRLARSRCSLFLGVKRPNARNDDWSPGPFRDLGPTGPDLPGVRASPPPPTVSAQGSRLSADLTRKRHRRCSEPKLGGAYGGPSLGQASPVRSSIPPRRSWNSRDQCNGVGRRQLRAQRLGVFCFFVCHRRGRLAWRGWQRSGRCQPKQRQCQPEQRQCQPG